MVFGYRLGLTNYLLVVNTMANKSQRQRLLEHLQSGETITSLEAFTVLGITQLSARIVELERDGHLINHERITVQNRFGEDVRVVRYSMESL